MKTIFLKNRSPLVVLFISIFSICFISCSKENNDDNNEAPTYTARGDGTGAQVNPPVTTSGTATLAGTYNSGTNKFEYNVNWTSLSDIATLIEIHGPADAGANGNLVTSVAINDGGVTGSIASSITLTEQQEADLQAGKYYFTVVNLAHITGEVRGQIFLLVR